MHILPFNTARGICGKMDGVECPCRNWGHYLVIQFLKLQPETEFPSFYLQDSNDENGTVRDKTYGFLDSDGLYNTEEPRNKTDHVELEDGQWHMLTLTTNPKTKGYRIYIDGQLAANTPDVDGKI